MGKFNPNNFVVDKVLSVTIYTELCFCGFKQDMKNALWACPKCGRALMETWNEVQMLDLNGESDEYGVDE